MTVLTNGLEKVDTYGAAGWNDIHDSNMEKLDGAVGGPLVADNALGVLQVADPLAATVQTLTDSTTGTPGTTINPVSGSGADAAINDIFASLVNEINALRVDNQNLRAKLQEVINKQRKTGGCGVFDDEP